VFRVDTPMVNTYRDGLGNLWEIRLRADVKLLERAVTEEKKE